MKLCNHCCRNAYSRHTLVTGIIMPVASTITSRRIKKTVTSVFCRCQMKERNMLVTENYNCLSPVGFSFCAQRAKSIFGRRRLV
jgi:hypothetical protein